MKIENLSITQFNPKTASEADFEKVVRIQLESFKENNPNDPPPPEHMIRKQTEMIASHPIYNIDIYIVENSSGQLSGGLIFLQGKSESEDYENQKHMAMLIPLVLPEFRRQGVGTQLLKFGVEKLSHNKEVTLVQGDTSKDAGRAFAQNLGASIGLEARDSRAQVKDLNWEMIEQWALVGGQSNPDVTIELFEGLPSDKDIEAYSQLYTEVFNQQPFDDIEGLEATWSPERLREVHARMQEVGSTDYVMVTREANGDLSGMTELSYNPERSHRAGQGLTGVQENYRGRGLGKWLKAKMLLYMRENFPTVEHIATTNAASNAAMLSINERLGFKLHKHNTLFKISIDDLRNQLDI